MSQKKAKAARRAMRERPAYLVNADYVRRTADAVLAVDMSDVPSSRVRQFALGWCRGAFAQSRIIADLTSAGMASFAAPNRRLFAELTVRIHWLADMAKELREGAVDEMLAHGIENTRSTLRHMENMGWPVEYDATELDDFVLNVTSNTTIKDQSRKFASAAYATEVKNGPLYGMWREESGFSHPTSTLAGHYAPVTARGGLGAGEPSVMDPELEAHRHATILALMFTTRLLRDEGVEDDAVKRLTEAHFSV